MIYPSYVLDLILEVLHTTASVRNAVSVETVAMPLTTELELIGQVHMH